MSSAADWPVPRPPGRSRHAACRSCCTKCGPARGTEAHRTDGLAELVCSNSLRSDDRENNAVGLLHEEMRRLELAGDAGGRRQPGSRRRRARGRPRRLLGGHHRRRSTAHPLIEIVREEIALPPPEWDSVIVATGPLTSPALAEAIGRITGEDALAFFDAIAPIVHRDSIDMDVAWFQSRYDKAGPGGSGADYINCPMDRAQYEAFVAALVAGDKTSFQEWEKTTPYFDGCLPIEVMAERGPETLRHGPMKPFGLTNPHDPQTKAYAVVQLRQDNKLGTLYNMVGFQTKLKHGEQIRIFRTIPGLRTRRVRAARRPAPQHLSQFAEAARRHAAARSRCRGCASPARSPAARAMWNPPRSACWPAASPRPSGAASRLALPPRTTAHGALLAYITGGHVDTIDAGPALLPADERQFRPVPAAGARCRASTPDGTRLRGTEKTIAKKAGDLRPRARRSRSMDRRRADRRGIDSERQRCASRSRAARHSAHCRRHCGSSARIERLIAAAAPCGRAPAAPAPPAAARAPLAARHVAEQRRAPRRDGAAPAAATPPAPRAARSSPSRRTRRPPARRSAPSGRPADRAGRARHGSAARAAARRSHRRSRHAAASSPMPRSRPSARMRAASSISADEVCAA